MAPKASAPAKSGSVPSYLRPTAAVAGKANTEKFEYKDIKQSGAALAVAAISKMKAGSAAEARKLREAMLNQLREELAKSASLKGLKKEQLQLLTKEDLGKMTVEQLASLPPSMMAHFTAEQLQGLSESQVAALTVDHLAAMNPEQISALPASLLAQYNEKMLSQLSPEQRAALERLGVVGGPGQAQVGPDGKPLPPGSLLPGAKGGKGKQLWVLTKEQLKSMQGGAGDSDSFMKEFNIRTIDAANLKGEGGERGAPPAGSSSSSKLDPSGDPDSDSLPPNASPSSSSQRRPKETFQQWRARMTAALRDRRRSTTADDAPGDPSFIDEEVSPADDDEEEDRARRDGSQRPSASTSGRALVLPASHSQTTSPTTSSQQLQPHGPGEESGEIPEEIIIVIVPSPPSAALPLVLSHENSERLSVGDAPALPPLESAGGSAAATDGGEMSSSIQEVAWGRSHVMDMSRRTSLASVPSEGEWIDENIVVSTSLSQVPKSYRQSIGLEPDLDVIEEHIISTFDSEEIWRQVRELKLSQKREVSAAGRSQNSVQPSVRSTVISSDMNFSAPLSHQDDLGGDSTGGQDQSEVVEEEIEEEVP